MGSSKKQIEDTEEFGSISQPLTSVAIAASGLYVGSLIGNRYLIEKELGRGGIGVVYLGRDQQLLSRPVVIKVLLEESAKDQWFKKKFKQEMEALARINHPGVIGVLDAGQMPDGKPYLVMQFVEGIVLRLAMRPEGMSFQRAADIIRQIGQALSMAHEKGVYHRDLKPENIMLEKLDEDQEQVKLIDFGIAKVVDSKVGSSRESTAVAGTILYMAPEQLMGKASAASDTYALGIIAYEMLCGRRPFNPESPYQLLEMQKAGVKLKPRDLRPGIAEAAESAILKALSFDSKDRHLRARDLGDEIARALEAYQLVQADASQVTIVRKEHVPINGGGTKKKLKLAFIIAVAIMAVIITGFLIISPVRKPAAPSVSPVLNVRQLDYSITLLRNPKTNPGAKPIRLSRETLFSAGDRLRLDIFSPQPGWLYILNEGPATQAGMPQMNMVFPLPRNKQNSAAIAPNQPVQIPGDAWFVMDNDEGAEKLWLVWSASEIPELDNLKKWDNEKDKGEIKDVAEIKAAQTFLSEHSVSKVAADKDDELIQTNLKANGDVLVYLITLAHRR